MRHGPQFVDVLEPRIQFAATLEVNSNQTLLISGGDADEQIQVFTDATGSLRVGVSEGTELVTFGRYKPSQVLRIHIDGGNGNDLISLDAPGLRSATVLGGAGADAMFIRVAQVSADGGEGNDRITFAPSPRESDFPTTLLGGAGSDRLLSTGRVIADGGSGNDILHHAGSALPIFDTELQFETTGELAQSIVQGNRTHDYPATLIGGGGNDLFYPAADDQVIGGAGKDVILLEANVPNLRKPFHRFDTASILADVLDTQDVEVFQVTLS